MKYMFLIATLMIVGCSSSTDEGCSKDSDCKGDRVCHYGECVESVSPTPTPSKKSCGEVDIGCNCASTSASPGLVTSTSLCESGRHQFLLCPYACSPYTSAWETVCYCN